MSLAALVSHFSLSSLNVTDVVSLVAMGIALFMCLLAALDYLVGDDVS